MTLSLILIILALICGFYMAWNIGANDVANAMGTSVGSGALTLKRAIILAAVFEFLGAFLVGSHVSETVRKGIFDPTLIGDPMTLALGMIACLLAAGIWLQVASYFGWPVSTTHAIVGAVVGFGIVVVGVHEIDWLEVGRIASSWVISPLFAAAFAYLLFRILLKLVFHRPDPISAAKQIAPQLAFCVLIVMISVTSFKGFKPVWISYGIKPDSIQAMAITSAIAIFFGLIGAFIAGLLVRKIKSENNGTTNRFQAVYVMRSLDKAMKHVRRIRATTNEELQEKANTLLDQLKRFAQETEETIDYEQNQSVYHRVERIFVYLQILSACFVAFAHGANDVANAIGPLSSAVQALHIGIVATTAEVPTWALLLGGTGIVIGLATWGWRVMETIGRRITELTPSRGFTAEFAAALTILMASLCKLPISTTHTLVGAVFGVGLARGIGAINLNTIRDIIASWLITIPAGAGLAVLLFYFMRLVFM